MEDIKRLLVEFKGELYNLCFMLLEMEGDPAIVFEYTCLNYVKGSQSGSSGPEGYIRQEEIETLETIYGGVVDGLLNSTIKKCNAGLLACEDFYKELWRLYSANFTTHKELAFAFYYTLIDASIPFQYLGKPISMSDKQYSDLVKINRNAIEKIKYIKRSGYSQQTERASLLLNCLEGIDNRESKVVVLSQAINIFNRNLSLTSDFDASSIIKRIDKKLQELELQKGEDKID